MSIVMMRYTVILLDKNDPIWTASKMGNFKDKFQREKKSLLFSQPFYRDLRNRENSKRIRNASSLIETQISSNYTTEDKNLRIVFGSATGNQKMNLAHGITFEEIAHSTHMYSVYLERYITTQDQIDQWLLNEADADIRLMRLCPRKDTISIRVIGHGSYKNSQANFVYGAKVPEGEGKNERAQLSMMLLGSRIYYELHTHAANTGALNVQIFQSYGAAFQQQVRHGESKPGAMQIGRYGAIETLGDFISNGGSPSAHILPCTVNAHIYLVNYLKDKQAANTIFPWLALAKTSLVETQRKCGLLPRRNTHEHNFSNALTDYFFSLEVEKIGVIESSLKAIYRPYPKKEFNFYTKNQLGEKENTSENAQYIALILEIHVNIITALWRALNQMRNTISKLYLMRKLYPILFSHSLLVSHGNQTTVIDMLKSLIDIQRILLHANATDKQLAQTMLDSALKNFFQRYKTRYALIDHLERDYLSDEYDRYMEERPPDEF